VESAPTVSHRFHTGARDVLFLAPADRLSPSTDTIKGEHAMSTAVIRFLSAIVTFGFLCQDAVADEIPGRREAPLVERSGWDAFVSESKRLIWMRGGAFRAISHATK
jgi:hypothetical protein